MAVILTWTTSIHLEMSLNENFIQITNSIFLKNREKKNFPYKLDTQIDSQAKKVVLLQKGVISTLEI